jgi:hypothetical protein
MKILRLARVSVVMFTLPICLFAVSSSHVQAGEESQIVVLKKDGERIAVSNPIFKADCGSRKRDAFIEEDNIRVSDPVALPKGLEVKKESIPISRIKEFTLVDLNQSQPGFQRAELSFKDGKRKEVFVWTRCDRPLSSIHIMISGQMNIGGKVTEVTFNSPDIRSVIFEQYKLTK